MKINKLNIYLCIISLFLTIILFSYVFYKSEILAAGHKHDYYLKYFVTTFVLFFFSIFILFLKKNTIFACFTIIISSTITIYTVELFLTINLKKSSNVKLKYIDEFKKAEKNYEKN